MTSGADFMTAIRSDRAESDTRLVYADWLDDQERGVEAALQRVLARPASDEMRLAYASACEAAGDAQRAEFVRVQVEIGRLPESARRFIDSTKHDLPFSIEAALPHMSFANATPEQEQVVRNEFANIGRLQNRERELSRVLRIDLFPNETRYHHAAFGAEAARGFFNEITCSAADWFAHGDDIVDAHPVTRVALTTLPYELPRPRPLPISRTMPAYADIDIAGQMVRFNERELVTGKIPGMFDPASEFIVTALGKRWPGVVFDLPPRTVGWGAAPVYATPIADPRAARELMRGRTTP